VAEAGTEEPGFDVSGVSGLRPEGCGFRGFHRLELELGEVGYFSGELKIVQVAVVAGQAKEAAIHGKQQIAGVRPVSPIGAAEPVLAPVFSNEGVVRQIPRAIALFDSCKCHLQRTVFWINRIRLVPSNGRRKFPCNFGSEIVPGIRGIADKVPAIAFEASRPDRVILAPTRAVTEGLYFHPARNG